MLVTVKLVICATHSLVVALIDLVPVNMLPREIVVQHTLYIACTTLLAHSSETVGSVRVQALQVIDQSSQNERK